MGISLAVVGLLSAIAQGWLTRIIIPKTGERRAVLLGCIGYAVAFALFGFASEGWMMYAILVASSVFWVSMPAMQSLVSQNTPAHEQGELQGSLVSLSSLAAIITPLVTTKLFAYFTASPEQHYVPGAPYFFAALVSVVAWLVLVMDKHGKKTESPQ
ncbi:Tetracycline resistance protein, class C [compost metagenome]